MPVYIESLGDFADVIVGYQQLQIGFQHAVVHVRSRRLVAVVVQFLVLFFFEFAHRFMENFLVRLESELVDESALLSAQKVSGTADVQVAHGDVQTTSQVAELGDGPQPFLRFFRNQGEGRGDQMAKRLFVAAPHATAQLVQVAQTEVVGVVDEDGVGVGDVYSGFDDCRGYQHIEIPFDEVGHHLFEFRPFQTPVTYPHASIRHQALDHPRHFMDVFDLVVDEKHLSTSIDLVRDGVADHVFPESVQFGTNGVAVGRRSADDAHVPRSHHRKLQRAWDGRGGEGEGVDRGAKGFEFVFHTHAELLLLVDDQQTQIREFHLLSHQFVGADDDVDFAFSQGFERFRVLLPRYESIQQFDVYRKLLQPLFERAVMLHGQYGGGHQYRHLLAVGDRFEGGADGHLGFSESHVAAYQSVHGRFGLHVFFYGLGGCALIGGVFENE